MEQCAWAKGRGGNVRKCPPDEVQWTTAGALLWLRDRYGHASSRITEPVITAHSALLPRKPATNTSHLWEPITNLSAACGPSDTCQITHNYSPRPNHYHTTGLTTSEHSTGRPDGEANPQPQGSHDRSLPADPKSAHTRPHHATLTPMCDNWHTRIRCSLDGFKDFNAWVLPQTTTRDIRHFLACFHPEWDDYRLCLHSRDLQPGEKLADYRINEAITIQVAPRQREGMRRPAGDGRQTTDATAAWLGTHADSVPSLADELAPAALGWPLGDPYNSRLASGADPGLALASHEQGSLTFGNGRNVSTIDGGSEISDMLHRSCSALHLCATYTQNILADVAHLHEPPHSQEEFVEGIELARLDVRGDDLERLHCSEAGYNDRPPAKCQQTFLYAFAEKLPQDLAEQLHDSARANHAAWRLRDSTLRIANNVARLWHATPAVDELLTWYHRSCNVWEGFDDQHTVTGNALTTSMASLLDIMTDTPFGIRARHGLHGPKNAFHTPLRYINLVHHLAEQLRGKVFDAFAAHCHLQHALQNEARIRCIRAEPRAILTRTQLCSTVGRPTHRAAAAFMCAMTSCDILEDRCQMLLWMAQQFPSRRCELLNDGVAAHAQRTLVVVKDLATQAEEACDDLCSIVTHNAPAYATRESDGDPEAMQDKQLHGNDRHAQLSALD